jgi:glycine hydroxymethyltransferase
MRIAASEQFHERQQRTLDGAREMAASLLAAGNGIEVLTGGTDVHLVLVDLRRTEITGQEAEDRLAEVNITVNRNAVPFDPRPPRVASGLRIGSPAMVTRGLGPDDFHEIGEIIGLALGPDFESQRADLLERALAIVERYPLYAELASHV